MFRVRSAITIGAGCIGAPIGVAEYKVDACVRCASPIFIPIADKLSLTNRKRKYVAEKTTGPLKSKQTSITTVRCPILSAARLPTPLIFRYPLPLSTGISLLLRNYLLILKILPVSRFKDPKAAILTLKMLTGSFKKYPSRNILPLSPQWVLNISQNFIFHFDFLNAED